MKTAKQLIEERVNEKLSRSDTTRLMRSIRDALEYVAGQYVETRVKHHGSSGKLLVVWALDKEVLRAVHSEFIEMAERGVLSRELRKYGVAVQTRGYDDGLHVQIKSDGKLYVHLQDTSDDGDPDASVRGMTHSRYN